MIAADSKRTNLIRVWKEKVVTLKYSQINQNYRIKVV
jgi:hypothetical protein